MKKLTKANLTYTMEERGDGFLFSVIENGYEQALIVENITREAAESFYELLAENEVMPGHLYCVAEDCEFATISHLE